MNFLREVGLDRERGEAVSSSVRAVLKDQGDTRTYVTVRLMCASRFSGVEFGKARCQDIQDKGFPPKTGRPWSCSGHQVHLSDLPSDNKSST